MSAVPLREDPPEMYDTKEDAAKAACAWVEQGKVKVDRSKLRIYKSKVGPVKKHIVGELTLNAPRVGLLRNSGIIEDIVRIDNDDTGKGIHFNAKNLSDTSQKLAACIQPTVSMTATTRMNLFYEYLNALENLSADTIWDWWRTGTKLTEDEAEAEAEAGSVSAAVKSGTQ